MTLKTRVIPVLLLRNGELVKGRKFDGWRRVGSPVSAVRIYETRQVDELIVLDIAATPENRGPDFDLIGSLVDECFMPLTVGGGVRSLDDIRTLLSVGADKVAICTAAVDDPSLITKASEKFGAQAVVVSIDVHNGDVTTHCGTQGRGVDPVRFARDCAFRGAGEILLNSIERDGMLDGYDLPMIEAVSRAVSVPVVACGGAGEPEHLRQAIRAGAHAAAAGALWQFTEYTPLEAKRFMSEAGIAVRL